MRRSGLQLRPWRHEDAVIHWLERLRGEDFPALRHGIPESEIMRFKELQTVVLRRDLPDEGLREGDLGAVVQVYEPDGLEVEFVSASGKTEALVTRKETDVRAVADGDLIAVRRLVRPHEAAPNKPLPRRPASPATERQGIRR